MRISGFTFGLLIAAILMIVSLGFKSPNQVIDDCSTDETQIHANVCSVKVSAPSYWYHPSYL